MTAGRERGSAHPPGPRRSRADERVVRLRPYEQLDYAVVRRFIDDAEAAGPFPQAAPQHSDEEVRRIVGGPGETNLARFGIEVDGRLVGEVQYRHSPPLFPPQVYGLGVMVWRPADRGHGHGREAQRQLVDLLFRERGARRVQGETDPRNAPERRCLEAIGFSEEGILRAYFGPPGEGDLVVYALLREDWERSRGVAATMTTRPPTTKDD